MSQFKFKPFFKETYLRFIVCIGNLYCHNKKVDQCNGSRTHNGEQPKRRVGQKSKVGRILEARVGQKSEVGRILGARVGRFWSKLGG